MFIFLLLSEQHFYISHEPIEQESHSKKARKEKNINHIKKLYIVVRKDAEVRFHRK